AGAGEDATESDRVILVCGAVVGNDDLRHGGSPLALDSETWSIRISADAATLLPSAPMILMINDISFTYAERLPATGPQGGGPAGLLLRRGRRAVLHAIGRLPAGRHARGRGGTDAARAPSTWGQPDRRRPNAGRTRRGHPRQAGRGPGGAVGHRRPARRAPAGGLPSNRPSDAHAPGDRPPPRLLSPPP